MGERTKSLFFGAVLLLLVVAAGCSGSDDPASSESAGGGADELTSCEAAAQEVVAEFDAFLAPFADRTPGEFLADPELDGLEAFQNDVAEIIVRVATNPNDNCTERDLESQVDLALAEYTNQGLLAQYLVGAVREGVQVEQRDVAVTPDDDLLAILPLLGPGSSITFSEGTFDLSATILVQNDLIMVGAGRDETIITSSADTAALAVLGQGNLVINHLTVRHVGDIAASVLLAIDAPIELVGVGVVGGVVDEEGAGGSGIVLTNLDADASVPTVLIDDSFVSANGAAGIAVTGSFAPTILNSVIHENAQCGICYFDTGAGEVQGTTLSANGVGIQASGQSAPELSVNTFDNNLVAGLLIEDESIAIVLENNFIGVDIVGVDVQGSASPILQRNTFGPHAVAMSFREASTVSASNNQVTGGDVAVLVGGSAEPLFFENTIADTMTTAILSTGESAGEFVGNTVTLTEGAAIVVEGSATPLHRSAVIDGGLAGAVFRETSNARLIDSTLTGQEVGFEVDGDAVATIELNTFIGSVQAGAILNGQGASLLRNNEFDEPVAIGIQAGGSGDSLIEGNTVTGGDTAALVTESSQATLMGNTFTDQNFGISVSGDAAPVVVDNEIVNASAGALSFEGSSAGTVEGNMIVDAGVVGIRVAGDATPTIKSNQLFALVPPGSVAPDDAATEETEDDAVEDDAVEDDAVGGSEGAANQGDTPPVSVDEADVSGAGILYAEQGGGVAQDNEVFGFVIGIQVSDDAAPTVRNNRVDGVGIGGVGILYGINAAGLAEGNLSINQQLGFQLSGTTSPTLTDNVVEAAGAAAYLLQGETTAVLQGNSCPGSQAGIVLLEQAEPELDDNECQILN